MDQNQFPLAVAEQGFFRHMKESKSKFSPVGANHGTACPERENLEKTSYLEK